MSGTRQTPGVFLEQATLPAAAAPPSGVPLFLGRAKPRQSGESAPVRLTLWADFERRFETPPGGHLAAAVRGFFDNGGRTCYVCPLTPDVPLAGQLESLEGFAEADLIAAPDLPTASDPAGREAGIALRQTLLRHCDRAGRFAILDAVPGADPVSLAVRLGSNNGALYYPWVRVAQGLVPPCGHVAGVYARRGIAQAPANEVLEGALDLEVPVDAVRQGPLNEAGVNCLRAFPGRGIVVWGARTLSPDPAWRYITVRRVFVALRRWAERNLVLAAFEPNDPQLWARIGRELTGHLTGLFRAGATAGRTPEEAFYVKCDAQTNPPEVRDAGQVIAEVGLAVASPSEFIVVRVVQTEGATFLQGQAGLA